MSFSKVSFFSCCRFLRDVVFSVGSGVFSTFMWVLPILLLLLRICSVKLFYFVNKCLYTWCRFQSFHFSVVVVSKEMSFFCWFWRFQYIHVGFTFLLLLLRLCSLKFFTSSINVFTLDVVFKVFTFQLLSFLRRCRFLLVLAFSEHSRGFLPYFCYFG